LGKGELVGGKRKFYDTDLSVAFIDIVCRVNGVLDEDIIWGDANDVYNIILLGHSCLRVF